MEEKNGNDKENVCRRVSVDTNGGRTANTWHGSPGRRTIKGILL